MQTLRKVISWFKTLPSKRQNPSFNDITTRSDDLPSTDDIITKRARRRYGMLPPPSYEQLVHDGGITPVDVSAIKNPFLSTCSSVDVIPSIQEEEINHLNIQRDISSYSLYLEASTTNENLPVENHSIPSYTPSSYTHSTRLQPFARRSSGELTTACLSRSGTHYTLDTDQDLTLRRQVSISRLTPIQKKELFLNVSKIMNDRHTNEYLKYCESPVKKLGRLLTGKRKKSFHEFFVKRYSVQHLIDEYFEIKESLLVSYL